MELKEIIALTKRWWWLILTITAVAFTVSYLGYGHLDVEASKRVFSATSRIELPRDTIRIVSFRESASAKRIYIDSSTELAMLNSEDNRLAAARYCTLLDLFLSRLERYAQDKNLSEESVREKYGKVRRAMRTAVEIQPRELENASFPRSYVDAFITSSFDDSLRNELKLQNGDLNLTIEEINEVFNIANQGSNETELLGLVVRSKVQDIPDFKVEKDNNSRIVNITANGSIKSGRKALLWADAVALAAARESFRRILVDVDNVITRYEDELARETKEPDADRAKALVAQANMLMDEINTRSQALREGLRTGSVSSINRPNFNVSFPTFTAPNAVAERMAYYGRLVERIRSEFPGVASDSLTNTPVGGLERNEHTSEKMNLRGLKSDLSRAEKKLHQTLTYEKQRLDAERGVFISYRQAGNPESYVPNHAIIRSEDMRAARREINTLQRERDSLNLRYTPSSDKMQANARELQVAIEHWTNAVDAAFKARELELSREIGALSDQIENLKSDASVAKTKMDDAWVRMNTLKAVATIYDSASSELFVAQTAIDEFKNYRGNLIHTRDEQGPVIRVFAFAGKAVSTGTTANSLQIAAIVSFIVLAGSVIMVYILTLARNKITTEFDVRKHINLPVLSKLPRRPDAHSSLLDISPRSGFAEQFSTVATLVRSYGKELSLRSMLITSAVKEEGKTDIVCNLGIALARKGLRVLIIDADYHRSRVERFFDITSTTGVIPYLESGEGADITDFSTPSPAEGLELLCPGGTVGDPVRMLESEAFQAMLKETEAKYDFVIVDSPPVARVGDALILASEVDATIFVVSSGDVSFADAALAKRLLTNVQANLLGVIINNAKDARAREYYNYYYEGTRRRVRKVPD